MRPPGEVKEMCKNNREKAAKNTAQCRKITTEKIYKKSEADPLASDCHGNCVRKCVFVNSALWHSWFGRNSNSRPLFVPFVIHERRRSTLSSAHLFPVCFPCHAGASPASALVLSTSTPYLCTFGRDGQPDSPKASPTESTCRRLIVGTAAACVFSVYFH